MRTKNLRSGGRQASTQGIGFLVKVLFVLLIIFIGFQLYILTTVGVQGETISGLRSRQAELKIENEIKRAKVLELQSTGSIEDTVEGLQMRQVGVQYISSGLTDVSAMN